MSINEKDWPHFMIKKEKSIKGIQCLLHFGKLQVHKALLTNLKKIQRMIKAIIKMFKQKKSKSLKVL